MSRKADRPQSRHHILVEDDDWEWLEMNYGLGSGNPIGTGVACKKIISWHVKRLRAKFQARDDERQTDLVSREEAVEGAAE